MNTKLTNSTTSSGGLKKQKPFIVFDNIKGLLIISVVLTHMLTHAPMSSQVLSKQYILFFMYGFHMPLFSFISGFFSKRTSLKSILRLVYCYLAFLAINSLFFPFSKLNLLTSTTALATWYLVSLIYFKLSVLYFGKHKKRLITLSILLFFVIPFFFHKLPLLIMLALVYGRFLKWGTT
jgi:fucose 4-O-acetylase-like acetyltransferase